MRVRFKRIVSAMLIFCLCIAILPAMTLEASAAEALQWEPNPYIEYRYRTNVSYGTIRYISQLTSSQYFHKDYWGKWKSQAIIECGTSAISMSLSYIGINKTPKNILDEGSGQTHFTWDWGGATHMTYSYGDLATAVDNYVHGKGKYSPPIIHLDYYSRSGHFVVIIGYVSKNVYKVLDPASSKIWEITISGSKASYYHPGSGSRISDNINRYNTYNDVFQWYNPDAYICDHAEFYNDCGVCGACGFVYNWEETLTTEEAGYYKVISEFTPRTDKPYSAANKGDSSFAAGSYVTVTGAVTNAFDNLWYQISYGNGKIGYVYHTHLEKDTYLDSCTSYPAHGIIKAAADTEAMTLPCSTAMNPDATVVTSVSKGSTYTVTELVSNSQGAYWYELVTPEGMTAYLPAAQAEYTDALYGDVTITNVAAPTVLGVGKYFSIAGEIRSVYNNLYKVAAYVYKGTEASGSAVTGGSDTTGGKYYSLYNSRVDGKVLFDRLAAGKYVYAVYADYISYYMDANQNLTTTTGTVCLYTTTLTVGGTASGCSHSYDAAVTTAPTCTENGVMTYTCSQCEVRYTETVAASGHHYDVSVAEPSCTAAGQATYTCGGCGYSYSEVMDATGHSFVCEEIVLPTCTESGYSAYACENCDATYQGDHVAPTGHHYEAVITEPICTEGGYTTYTCTHCGDTYRDHLTLPPGHRYEGVATAPTCTEKGYTTYTCTACGDAYQDDYVSPTGHHYDAVITDPTCTGEGYTTYTCTTCGDTYQDDFVTPAGHHYKKTVTEPTCTAQGYTTYTCVTCGDAYQDDYVSPTGHHYDVVVTEPTCTEGGYTTYICIHCDYSYLGNFVEPIGHHYDAVVTEATCTEGGYTTYTCLHCEDTYQADFAEPNGHHYDAVVTEATCTEDGYTTYTCTECGDSYTGDRTDATGHSYIGVDTAPTCTEEGYTTYTCEDCGESYTDAYVAPVDHDFVGGKCTGCGLPGGELGDANGDGKVDSTDAKLIMQYDLGLISGDYVVLALMDVNGDGSVDSTDAKLVMQLDLGLIAEFPKP